MADRNALEAHRTSDMRLLCGICVRRLPLLIPLAGNLFLAILYLSIYASYETHGQRGTVVAAYVDSNINLEQVISYSRVVNGISLHRNCSLWKESYGHRSRAERAADRIVLGTVRTVYLPVHDSDRSCVDSSDIAFYRSQTILYFSVATFVLILLLIACCDDGRQRRTGPTTVAEQVEEADEDEQSDDSEDSDEEDTEEDLEAPAAIVMRPVAAAPASAYTSVHNKPREY
jgi:hypothetical protein